MPHPFCLIGASVWRGEDIYLSYAGEIPPMTAGPAPRCHVGASAGTAAEQGAWSMDFLRPVKAFYTCAKVSRYVVSTFLSAYLENGLSTIRISLISISEIGRYHSTN